ncbi:hypothetical protein EDI_323420, partial [Entamoeba dispar SAW760]
MKHLLIYIYLLTFVSAKNTCINDKCKEANLVVNEQNLEKESDEYWEDIIEILKGILGDNYVYIMSDGDSPKEVFEKFVQFINNNWITRQIKRVFETSIEFKGLLTDFYNACQTGIKMSKEADKDKMKS